MRRLPPLTTVEAFVQVARLGSVKAAADELALSSPALSRRVQALERFIGRQLFERRHQSMKLNMEGEILLSRIAPALDALAEAIDATTGDNEHLRLKLSALPLFAQQRLMPLLPELKDKHPELHIDIDTSGHGLSRLGEGIDVAIVLSREIDPTLYARRLDRNRVFAIGARSLSEGRRALRKPEQLREHTVLIHRDMPETFETWREALGVPDLEPAGINLYDSGQLMLEAAAQGLGIAFMLESHYSGAHDKRIVQLFSAEDVDSPYNYWFACKRLALGRRPVRLFHDWLLDNMPEAQPA
ncbi:LysR substrate-binding domain-containing protein [Flavisphingomonas formosensis]|uniref:LysR substrate-binding domain-containing protein n=1 Tax=Flavisphingomonas formosensis TaxID=861534 RepID=UPI0018DEF256|nr:LysR substrate-binding domain-containing protein [Sphingomonas formosensis]